ncbi:thiol reductant ABC exporter subunit CydD [Cryobacterium tagatosivorans]|uniref:Thiol reductant ABC exporter subunit CydD n=1 Tax=Cryobacterium tagatosivorans TaxID=1259199 RepID=A0A4R8UFI8_9MICO|nr:thiol reductant ABC exporter subunit CydD [Cryobacterium tagatosivorans]TFB51988.1 thiol reductant ABC exporter subunit CydD [Cryobacterium tagatosivorans]
MRPLDPRLLRYASAARRFLVVGAVLGLAQTVVTVAVAWLLSRGISQAIDGKPLEQLAGTIGALAAAVVLRAGLVWLLEVAANRGAAEVKSQLRGQVLARIAERGPDWLAGRQGARLSTVTTVGLDALDNYFSRYLPQLLLTVIATPILVAVMLWQDLPSGIIVIVVLPVIPVFMVLIGRATQSVQRRQWESLQRLGTGFLDLVGGLGTLKIFGRERRQSARLRAITEEYRTRTMTVLRVSFLSGFVLELAASLSVALVAVSVGLRLVDGSLALGAGLFVLLLAPEAFLPVRQVGAQFHAAADGLAAAEDVFEILGADGDSGTDSDTEHADAAGAAAGPPAGGRLPERPAPAPADSSGQGSVRGPRLGSGLGLGSVLRFEDVTIPRGGIGTVDGFDAEFGPGELAVISGPSGIGKSTLVAALQGFVPFTGRITLGGEPVGPGGRRPWLAWAGQRPGLFAGTIEGNVTLGEASVDHDALTRSLAWSGAADLAPATRLGVAGQGLSGGQAQRVAAARAIYRSLVRGCPVVVFDEPSSALDAEAEAVLVDGLRRLAATGRIVIVVSHRPALAAAADQVVRMRETSHV